MNTKNIFAIGFRTALATCLGLLAFEGTAAAQASACVGGLPDGNIQYEDGEECDDGNNVNGDGCDQVCFIEPGYSCTGPFDFSTGITTEGGGAWNITSEYLATQTINAPSPAVGYNFGADSKTPGLVFRLSLIHI